MLALAWYKNNQLRRLALCLLVLIPTAFAAQAAEEISPPPEQENSTTAESPAAAEPAEPLPVVPVTAQTPPAATGDEAENRLHDVIVTATKREKSARELPVTINAYSGEELMQRGVTNLEELVKMQPGTTKNGNRVVMRGIATSSTGTYGTSEEVGRFFDDVSLNAPSTRGALADLDPFDMQSVEVAKGPQGTLFGGTALAGAIRFVPSKPDFSGFSGALRAGLGSVAHAGELQQEIAVMLNGALGETLAVRGVLSQRMRPGTIDDLRSGQRDINPRDLFQARVLGSWQVLENLAVDATYLTWQEDEGDLGFTDRPDRYETRIRRIGQPSNMEAQLLSLKAQYHWETVSLIGIASQLETHWFDIVDLSPAVGVENVPVNLPLPVDARAKVPSYELRLASSQPVESKWWLLRDWDYLAGLFLMRGEQNVDGEIAAELPLPLPLPSPLPSALGTGVQSRARADIEERAFFFDLTRAFLDRRLELNLGGRLARSVLKTLAFTDEGGQQIKPDRNETLDSRFNPKAALTWRFTKQLSVYGSAAQGFRYGGVNGSPTADIERIPRTFKSDTLWNYEVGVRSEWLDKTLRLDLTGFRIDWQDLQIVQISTTAQNFVSNVGGARILGAEAMFNWNLPQDWPLLPPGLSLASGGSYIDARITERFESENGPVEPGTRLPLTPYVLLNGTLGWNGSIAGWLLGASVTQYYSGERKNELINTSTLPAYRSLAATLRLTNPGMHFAPEISVSGTNILDEPAQHFAFRALTGPNTLYVLNRPRTLLLSAQISF